LTFIAAVWRPTAKLRALPRVKVRHGVALVATRVTSDVYGDTRPVQGASVNVAGYSAKTNRAGVAVLRVPLNGARSRTIQLMASAGNTFVPAHSRVRLP
jgi:hypothetical protein